MSNQRSSKNATKAAGTKKLKLNKETISDLSPTEPQGVKGGIMLPKPKGPIVVVYTDDCCTLNTTTCPTTTCAAI